MHHKKVQLIVKKFCEIKSLGELVFETFKLLFFNSMNYILPLIYTMD